MEQDAVMAWEIETWKQEMENLLRLAGRICHYLEEGLNASLSMRDSILEGQVDQVKASVRAIQEVTGQLEKLQYERLASAKRFTRVLGLDDPKVIEDVPGVLKEITSHLPAQVRGLLPKGLGLAPGDREKQLAKEIEKTNRLCKKMADDSSESINFTLGLINSTRPSRPTYNRQGEVHKDRSVKSVLDKKV